MVTGGGTYIWGFATDGASPSSNFSNGNYIGIRDSAGNLATEVANGTQNYDSYNTVAQSHGMGGYTFDGEEGLPYRYDLFQAFYGENSSYGAQSASVSFAVPGGYLSEAYVVFIALASDQNHASFNLTGSTEGVSLPNSETYYPPNQVVLSWGNFLISGSYTLHEHTWNSQGGTPNDMTDMVGAFVFVADEESFSACTATSSTSLTSSTTTIPSTVTSSTHSTSALQACTDEFSAADATIVAFNFLKLEETLLATGDAAMKCYSDTVGAATSGGIQNLIAGFPGKEIGDSVSGFFSGVFGGAIAGGLSGAFIGGEVGAYYGVPIGAVIGSVVGLGIGALQPITDYVGNQIQNRWPGETGAIAAGGVKGGIDGATEGAILGAIGCTFLLPGVATLVCAGLGALGGGILGSVTGAWKAWSNWPTG